MIDLSVIIPVHNGEKYLEATVRKLLGVKLFSFEVIIVDDHSTDGTLAVAEKLAQEDNSISFHALSESSGKSAARNLGISVAKGRYVAFLDVADNFVDMVLGAVQTAVELEVDVLHTPGYFVSVAEQYIHFENVRQVRHVSEFSIGQDRASIVEGSPGEVIGYFLKNDFHWISYGKLYRREFLLEHDIRFPEDMNLAEGMFFLLPCLLHAKKYALYSKGIYIHNETGSSSMEYPSAEEALRALVENTARGLVRMEEFFRGLPSQEMLPLAKIRFCNQMDKFIGPISMKSPGAWEKLIQEGKLLLRDAWYLTRHLAGWHQILSEKQGLLAERQQLQVALTSAEAMIDRTMKAPRILVLASIYTMLLCTLLFRDWDKSIFVCGGGVPSSIVQNLRNLGIQCYGDGDGKIFDDEATLHCLSGYARRNNIPIYGNDDTPEATRFIEQDFIVVEDGNANYYPEVMEKQENVKRITTSGELYMPFGFSRFVKRVLLTGKHPIPDVLKEKTELFRIQDLWNKKTQREQDKILKLYSFPRKELEQQLRKGRDCLLLGSDNSGKGYCKEEQELAMYRDMIEPYGQKRIIVKPHHQNKTDFQKHFPDCYVLPKQFPVDLMKLLKLKLHRVIGADSSALSNVFPPQIIEDRIDLMRKYGIPVSTDSRGDSNGQPENEKEEARTEG